MVQKAAHPYELRWAKCNVGFLLLAVSPRNVISAFFISPLIPMASDLSLAIVAAMQPARDVRYHTDTLKISEHANLRKRPEHFST